MTHELLFRPKTLATASALALVLTACGGGGGGGGVASTPATPSTPTPSPTEDGSGDGTTTEAPERRLSGSITGFGSVFVGGVKFETDDAEKLAEKLEAMSAGDRDLLVQDLVKDAGEDAHRLLRADPMRAFSRILAHVGAPEVSPRGIRITDGQARVSLAETMPLDDGERFAYIDVRDGRAVLDSMAVAEARVELVDEELVAAAQGAIDRMTDPVLRKARGLIGDDSDWGDIEKYE